MLVRIRCRLVALSIVPALVGLGACGDPTLTPASRLIGTAPVTTGKGAGAVPAPKTAPSTSTTAPGAPTTAAPATSVDPSATTAASPAPTPAPAPTAASAAPPPTGAGPATTAVALVARVTAMYVSINYPVSQAEAVCLTSATDPTVLAAVEANGETAIAGKIAAGLVQALAKCEPESFLKEQDDITIDDYKVDATQARCVTKALDAAAIADPAVAQAYFEGTTTLPADKVQRLIDQLTPCVGAAKAKEIVTS